MYSLKKNIPIKIRKLRILFYLLMSLLIIWTILLHVKSVTNLQTNFLNLFSNGNENNIVETTKKIKEKVAEHSFNSSDGFLRDYSQLINTNNFQFLHLVECTENGNYPILLIAVHSSPANVEKRQAIRETWGMQIAETKLVFMMGSVENEEETDIIAAEHEKHKDIVQGNFKDKYKNLSYKHVMLLKYVVYHCLKINYLLKTDDDVFINMPMILMHIEDLKNENVAKPRKLLYCLPMIMSPAIREESKWRVTYEEFPGEYYPPYCLGLVEFFTTDTVLRIYQAAQISKFFWVDDVFVTGIAREAAKIKITPIPSSLHLQYNEMETLIKINNTYPNMIYSFLLGPTDMDAKCIRDLWNIITYRKAE